ncbi:aminotransferase class IV [Clostridium sp. CAG:265]|uniref:aminotransferase class IV n=1 Tax=Clostridium sp. CAG:265 TaxID=1262787 RepID=UPI0003404B2E|nr:aminotransferase class IV [Clostridium sp. CAG:265]CDB75830.1 branched-chain amino acid aminotransferase [Clostridium sp. CAG:265]
MREISYNKDYVKLDGGFYFAQGVFETILIKKEAIFLEEHINRLNKSIDIMNLGEHIDIKFIKNFIKEENLKNIVLKIVVTEKNIVFSTRKIKYSKEDYKNGFKIKLSSVLRNPTSNMTYIKSLSYNENLYEYNKANKEGFNEVVFLNIYGNIAEGATSNIFIIKDKKIYTPKISDGILPGVVRNWVIENFEVCEKHLNKKDLYSADEVFITNSVLGIMKVVQFEEKKYNTNVVEKIRSEYEQFIN